MQEQQPKVVLLLALCWLTRSSCYPADIVDAKQPDNFIINQQPETWHRDDEIAAKEPDVRSSEGVVVNWPGTGSELLAAGKRPTRALKIGDGDGTWSPEDAAGPAYDTTVSKRHMNKKDIFLSRGWGAGGMPFSVLYMNPHQQKAARSAPTGEEQMARALPLQAGPPPAPYQQIGLRNAQSAGSLPARRQYSIIPQLFVSYGWGPLGK